MMDLAAMRTAIVSELHQHLGYPVIMHEQASEKPDYPFIGYKFTMPFDRESPGFETQNVSGEDIQKTLTTYARTTLSITSYDHDVDDSFNLAAQAYAWFKYIAHDYLKDNGIVVRSLGSIENRDTLIADDYERRYGFDVRLSSAHTISKIESSGLIEKVESNKE